MKICIARSVPNNIPRDPFGVTMDTDFARRFIAHLSDNPGFCSSCGSKCTTCRGKYLLDFSSTIAGILDFPARLPGLIEEPEEFLPSSVPRADVLVAVAVNEEVLIAVLERFCHFRGVIIPVEDPAWISPSAIGRITEICSSQGVEIAFPRPFCTFAPAGGVLAEFREFYKIGLPRVDWRVSEGLIQDGEVRSSAPCGATYFTCRGLVGRRVDENLEFIADQKLSAYPCTASTAVDAEYRDSLIHKATKIQRVIVDPTLFTK